MSQTFDTGSETRGKALDATGRLLLERGYGAVSMDAVAATAGVARRTLYNLFPNKEALFVAAVERLWAELPTEHWRHEPDLGEVETLLARICLDVAEFWVRPLTASLVRTAIAEADRFPRLSTLLYERARGPALVRIEEVLASATASGELRVDDPALAARQMVGMVNEVVLWPRVQGLEATIADDVDLRMVARRAAELTVCFYRS